MKLSFLTNKQEKKITPTIKLSAIPITESKSRATASKPEIKSESSPKSCDNMIHSPELDDKQTNINKIILNFLNTVYWNRDIPNISKFVSSKISSVKTDMKRLLFQQEIIISQFEACDHNMANLKLNYLSIFCQKLNYLADSSLKANQTEKQKYLYHSLLVQRSEKETENTKLEILLENLEMDENEIFDKNFEILNKIQNVKSLISEKEKEINDIHKIYKRNENEIQSIMFPQKHRNKILLRLYSFEYKYYLLLKNYNMKLSIKMSSMTKELDKILGNNDK